MSALGSKIDVEMGPITNIGVSILSYINKCIQVSTNGKLTSQAVQDEFVIKKKKKCVGMSTTKY